MAFDSSAYLAKNSTPQAGGFDPSKYLADNKEHVESTPLPEDSSMADRISDLFGGQKILGAGLAKAKAEKEQRDFLPEGSKDKPIEKDLFGSDADRVKSSFGDTKGVGKMLLQKGFVDFAKNKDGELVAKDSSGTWHKDPTRFLSNPINWAESGVGKALPLAGGIGAAGLASETGPGVIPAAMAGGAAGEALRSSIGRSAGVYDGDVGDQAVDAGKEGLLMGFGEGAGRYALKPAMEAMGPSLRAGAQSIGEGLGNFGTKLGSSLTKVPESDIKTYFHEKAPVEQLYNNNGGDTQAMADEVRRGISDKVGSYKKGLNDQITEALKTAPKDPVEVTRVLDRLKEIRSGINEDLRPENVKDIDELIRRIEKTATVKKNSVTGYIAPDEKTATVTSSIAAGGPQKRFYLHGEGEPIFTEPGEIPSDVPGQVGQRQVPVIQSHPEAPSEPGVPTWAQDKKEPDSLIELPTQGRPTYSADLNKLHQINKFLQEEASPAYDGSPLGFKMGSAGANAAKAAGGVGRDIMNGAAETMPNAEAITGANAKLSRLHDVEDVMNKNLLEEGKTASPLYAGGSGQNPQVQSSLQNLGNEIGHNVLGDAQKLSAARTFGGTPELLPLDTTGKSLTRVGSGALMGAAAGSLFPGVGTVVGGAVGAAMTSPAMLKIGINSARAAATFAQSPLVQSAMQNPRIIQTIGNPALRQAVQDIVNQLSDGEKQDSTHYDPKGESAQPTEVAKQKFLEGN